MITARAIQDAAAFLDFQGDVPSEAFAPTGLDNMGPEQVRQMIAHAHALGYVQQ